MQTRSEPASVIRWFVFLWAPGQSAACAAQITGKVTDSSGSPLEYATVAVYDSSDSSLVTGVVTDGEGHFSIDPGLKGHFYLKSSFIGFRTATISEIHIVHRTELIELGNIPLQLGNTLEEVTVASVRPEVINKIDRQVFDAGSFQSARGGTKTAWLISSTTITMLLRLPVTATGSIPSSI